MFKTLPKHSSVLDLFPQRTQHGLQPQQQHFDMALSPGDTMDDSFGTQDISIDNSQGGAKYNDFSFDEESVLLNSPPSSAYFQTYESSPYGMDICSPSPGIPMCKKRITQQSVIEDSGGKVFGSKKELEPPIPSFNNPPGTLLKKLTADVSDTSSGTMSFGSLRSNRSSGKVGSIKSISTLKDRDPLSKARARARTGLPSSWMDQRPRSMIQLPDSQTIDVLSQGFADTSNGSGDAGDVSMEDAMDIDSPLAARRPPTAQLKPRPLSLFIPSATQSPALSQQNSALSPAPPPSSSIPSAISSGPDEFGRFFVDTPEPVEKTAIPRYNEHGQEEVPFLFGNRGSFPSLQRLDSSPVASPSAERAMRCTSATLPPPSSSASFANLFLNANRGSSTGSLNSAAQPKSAGLIPTSRIPSLRTKVMQRPGISALNTGQQAQETQSATVVPSARMATMNQRRALSAFIQPEQFSIQGPASRTAIPRPTSGLAKGRVVSMLMPSTSNGDDDVDDSGNEFSSPSMARGGHRRMRSNGGLGAIGRGGSLAMRTISQQQVKANSLFSSNDPSPVKPLLPFGDGEHSGKILPCHSVKEDGLMRITPATLRALLSGAYDAQISAYKIIDCRFAFEYEGGHIGGAINLNKDEDIEKFLFDDVIRRGELPVPCNSGMPGMRPPILVFHCEFSAKRGPTFAKHFRAKDRSRNAHVYPKLHYPELYILEGGYCSYFSAYPETCDPCGYVQMDAPQHSHARAADLGQFRKWNRTRSYTYGDAQAPTQNAPSIQPSQSAESTQYKRSAVPRPGAQYGTHERVQSYSGLHTLQEDHGSPEKDDVEDTPDLDHDQEFDAETPCVLTEAESNDDAAYYDAPETQDTSFDFEEDEGALDLAEFGASEATIDAEEHHEEVAEEEEEGEQEEDDDLDHADSSPCVTAEMKRNKKFGRSLLERTFKPLSFGKPSFIPQSRARGMARAVSHVV